MVTKTNKELEFAEIEVRRMHFVADTSVLVLGVLLPLIPTH